VIGQVETLTGSFEGGLVFLGVSAVVSASIILTLGLGSRTPAKQPADMPIGAPQPSTR
jgi:hypothetical protein